MKSKKDKGVLFLPLAIAAMLISAAVCITAKLNNYGMEGDEVFSYISSTSMGGFKGICFLDDQTWYGADYFADALTASGEERFNVKMVIDNQAMDTHPPLYYLFLNFVCSVFEGEFSVWFGIGLNIFFLFFVGIGLYLLIQYFIDNRYLSLFFSLVFCCSGFALSMVLFIRMYVLLMAIVAFQSWYHLKFYGQVTGAEGEYAVRTHFRQYAVLSVITIMGALTHYYFLVYQCLISALFVGGCLMRQKYRDSFRYAGTMVFSGIIYICLYPAVLNHLFFKYRGRDAVHKFLKGQTLFEDAAEMFKEFSRQMFKGYLVPLLAVLVLLTAYLIVKKKIGWEIKRGILLGLPLIVYFWGISKASPFVSLRYVSPVAHLLFAGLVIWAVYLARCIAGEGAVLIPSYFALGLIIFAMSFYFHREPLKSGDYTEKREMTEELSGYADYCVYITADEYNWKMWEDYIYYPEYDGLFFIDGRSLDGITDEKLKQQECLAVYIDKELDLEEVLGYLRENLEIQDCELMYDTAYTYVVLGKAAE